MGGMADRLTTATERRRAALRGGTWPERRVVATGISPVNPLVRWAELDCGHDVFRQRRPRIGATIVCGKCAEEEETEF